MCITVIAEIEIGDKEERQKEFGFRQNCWFSFIFTVRIPTGMHSCFPGYSLGSTPSIRVHRDIFILMSLAQMTLSFEFPSPLLFSLCQLNAKNRNIYIQFFHSILPVALHNKRCIFFTTT